jgi:hypothetical protein
MLKIGTRKDIDRLLPLFKRFQEEFSPWESFSEERIRQSFENLVFNPNLDGLLAIAETDEGEPGGFLVAVSVPSLFSEEKQTQELAFFVIPEERKSLMAQNLMKMYEYWAKEIAKADICTVSLIDDRVSKLYVRKGYVKAETAFMKRVN